jgi:hypothetical protein
LKRRRAASKYSFSRTRTLGIATSETWMSPAPELGRAEGAEV